MTGAPPALLYSLSDHVRQDRPGYIAQITVTGHQRFYHFGRTFKERTTNSSPSLVPNPIDPPENVRSYTSPKDRGPSKGAENIRISCAIVFPVALMTIVNWSSFPKFALTRSGPKID